MMKVYVLDRRHSEVAAYCDAHQSFVAKNRTVSKVLIRRDDSTLITVSLCRACARSIANNARIVGGAS